MGYGDFVAGTGKGGREEDVLPTRMRKKKETL